MELRNFNTKVWRNYQISSNNIFINMLLRFLQIRDFFLVSIIHAHFALLCLNFHQGIGLTNYVFKIIFVCFRMICCCKNHNIDKDIYKEKNFRKGLFKRITANFKDCLSKCRMPVGLLKASKQDVLVNL